ncbi:hypothetical protein AXJ10_gp93 [Gordonia phage GordTnk2]|uniref:Uncharacterized protein n=1 Tax=Gordonia phage GordTnk2 TaxID=1622192 RepID=A0A0E3X9S0_9CAUD|nr:hypothetical protein AXJ10_gp93 [Gordonia phage GordTnk2]AKC02833.1 hypothetical protein GordTnk2_93 [Gordonia phage GordTnk2]
MARINRKDVENKVMLLNSRNGYESGNMASITGAVTLRAQDNHYMLCQTANEYGGIHCLYSGTLRECAAYISGALARFPVNQASN